MGNPRFGELLRELRLSAGLSQEALAERAAMSVNGISALERGTNQAPQRETLALLVRALPLSNEERIKLERAAVRASRPRAPSKGAGARKNHNLPRLSTTFFGRAQDVDAVRALVGEAQLVPLTGPGGIGKTRLAIRVAEELLDEYRDGVRFVDLAPLRDAEVIPSAMSSQFGIKESEEESSLDKLVHALENKSVLLVLDNCEHLVNASAAIVQRLIAACPGLRVIATSRQSLNVPGEQIYRVASLERDAAVQLFCERAKRALGSFELSDENAASIERVVRHLDGIALAIELAAARMNLLSLSQLEARLSERFALLSGGSSLVLPRQQTMRTTMDWSYELLTESEQQLFRRLWVFPSSFTLEAVTAVCADAGTDEWQILDGLASLVDKSLVTSSLSGSVHRYRLLETVRAYAAEQLHDRAEVADLLRRHAAYYAGIAQRAEALLGRAVSTNAWAHSLEPELESFRAALDWAHAPGGDASTAARLLANLQEFWIAEGFAVEAARRAQVTLAAHPELGPSERAALWLTLARMRQELFVHPQVMLEAARTARELYETANDRAGLALALRQQGAAEMRLGRHSEAQADMQRSLDLYRELGDDRMVVRGLGYLASLLQVQGDYANARTTLLDVLRMAPGVGDDRIMPTAAMNLAEAEFALGDAAAAAERAQENLIDDALPRRSDMRATQESNLSAYLLALGKVDEARAMALSSIRDGTEAFVAVPLQHLAATLVQSHPRRAARLLGYVEAVFAAMGFSRQFTERYTYERLIETLRACMSEEQLAACMREGSAMNELQAVKLATQSVELIGQA